MTLTSDLIARTRRHLYSGEVRDERDKLNGAINASVTSLVTTYNRTGLQPGVMLGMGLEELFVWENASGTLTVSRGENGSTAASHADEAIIRIAPKFSDFAIFTAINAELDGLSAEGLYKVVTATLTYSVGTDAYDLTGVTDLIDIISVNFDANEGTERWRTLDRNEWRLRRDLPTSEFASGLSLTVNGWVSSGQSVVVTYKAPYTSLATTADNVETVSGLHAQAHDIVPLGAAIRLTVGGEVSRNFLSQGDTRRAEEVGAGARAGQMRSLAALRISRIEAEKARLYAQYPVMR